MKYLPLVLLFASPVSAQDLKLHLHSGSLLIGKSSLLEWTIQTKYGVLKIPTEDVRSIQFGLHYDGDMKERIEKAHKRLSSTTFKERDTATQDLIKYGKYAYPLLTKTDDAEQNHRIEDVKKRILEDNLNAAKYVSYDTIRTYEFEVKGKIDLPEFSLVSEDFEQVKVKLSKISRIQMYRKGDDTVQVKADGQWHDTGIYSEFGTKFTFKASGQVDLWAQGPGQYIVTPKGYNTVGKGGVFLAGALIMKIGEAGTPQHVGESATLLSTRVGNIYLHVVESPWNSSSSGSYTVNIRGD